MTGFVFFPSSNCFLVKHHKLAHFFLVADTVCINSLARNQQAAPFRADSYLITIHRASLAASTARNPPPPSSCLVDLPVTRPTQAPTTPRKPS